MQEKQQTNLITELEALLLNITLADITARRIIMYINALKNLEREAARVCELERENLVWQDQYKTLQQENEQLKRELEKLDIEKVE